MQRFWKNCKGAVTVMVSLLLIPAILVTGTGVDLARIYTARSILQDANQLAANSVLASYDALLQDLYGLFGYMKDDPELAELVDEYIRVAVFGEDEIPVEMGSFRLFAGSELHTDGISPAPGKTLANEAVLRRQIEEYVKFRAPAIVAELILEKLDVFEKIKEDAKVIKTKVSVDEGVEELEKYYRKIYDRLQEVNKCGAKETAYMSVVSTAASELQVLFGTLKATQESYTTAVSNYEDAERKYDSATTEKEKNSAKSDMDTYSAEMTELESKYEETCQSIKDKSSEHTENVKAYEDLLNDYINQLEDLRKECEDAEAGKEDLKNKIEKLENSLASGKCSDALVEGLTQPINNEKPVVEQYKDLLVHDIENMGILMETLNKPQIETTIELMKNAALDSYTLVGLKDVDFSTDFSIESDNSAAFDKILDADTTFVPAAGERGKGFVKFADLNGESKLFYEELVRIYSESEGKGAEKSKLNDAVTKIFKKAQEVFEGLVFVPEGALYLSGAEDTSDKESGSKFGTESSWGETDAGKKDIKAALDSDFLSQLAEPLDGLGNKILLMVYDTEMFSDASTPGEDEEEETDPERAYPQFNMAGIPLSTEVNYYFQSELEYLYNGNLKDADANLKSVAGMIFLVRFIMNYVASFTIPEINQIVTSVKAALAWTGPFAILAGELARLALSIGEAAIDVARLRNGDDVRVIKDKTTWKLSIGGLADAAMESIADSAIDSAFSMDSKEGDDDGLTMCYTDYLRLFLLLVPETKLAHRTGKLIELNMTNYAQSIGADEEKMASAQRYDLSDAITDFSITTTVDMRMLFLSMPFAQEGINGVVPPKTFPIVATDYRGY